MRIFIWLPINQRRRGVQRRGSETEEQEFQPRGKPIILSSGTGKERAMLIG
ncbi:hypothetical protein FORC17_1161 [Vibrio vulnificus]|nr:hypothetical protein FORC17_1161 [Vibrio vulnificus]